MPVVCKGTSISLGFRADILVADAVILEIKGVAALLPAHQAQIPTYLRVSHVRAGLLSNFHAAGRKDGLRASSSDTLAPSVALRGPPSIFVLKFTQNPHSAAAGRHDEALIQIRTTTATRTPDVGPLPSPLTASAHP
jgi:hypothetical protein